VRCIGHEPAETLLGAAPLLEGGFDPLEHRVESDPQPPHLGPVVGRLDPAREITGGDRAGGVADPRERTKAEPDEPAGEERNRDQHGDPDQGLEAK
jgi:hypothetical protein